MSNGKAVMDGSTGVGDKAPAEMMDGEMLILSLLAAVATPAA